MSDDAQDPRIRCRCGAVVAAGRVGESGGDPRCDACVEASRRAGTRCSLDEPADLLGIDPDEAKRHVPAARDHAPVPLADEWKDGGQSASSGTADVPGRRGKRPRSCPSCGRIMSKHAVICLVCGLNTETQRFVGTGLHESKPKHCIKCRYDMTGAPSVVCPECGTANTRRLRREREAHKGSGLGFEPYVRPLVYMAIGVPITFLIEWQTNGFTSGLAYVVLFALAIPVLGVAYFVTSVFATGVDERVVLATARLAGIYALADAAGHASGFVLFGMVSMAVWCFIAVAMVMEELVLDLFDAVVMVVATGVPRLGVVIGVYVLGRHLGWF
ncbi:MAG: hypothetical protein KF705_04630 [Phycisphaeraceae bacterium]|nr:hypothetical protein [Phycisphaeraceae bacterium]